MSSKQQRGKQPPPQDLQEYIPTVSAGRSLPQALEKDEAGPSAERQGARKCTTQLPTVARVTTGTLDLQTHPGTNGVG